VKGWNDAIKGMIRERLIFGDADTVGEKIAEAVAMGLDGITVDLPVNGHNVERIALLGEISLKVLS
jgi:alkanesulfonate monooxygenase SsuD/methylene tetrahydromethanopterin reductase-like flavin-dependent oxidoreductase (luciferase family)